MFPTVRLALLWCGCATLLSAQPVVYLRGVVNAASSAPAGLPAGGIAQGSLFTIYGANLGPATAVQASSFPLQNALAGVSVTVTQGATQVNAIPVFVSANQVNALMPSNAPLGMVSVTVTFGGKTSSVTPMKVVATNVGIFTVSGVGSGPGVVQNDLSDGTVEVNSRRLTTAPGQVITIYATGLGAISAPDNLAPPAGNLPVTVEAWVGGQSAKVLYSGRVPCCSGLDQINVQIPANAPAGCWVPVYVRTAGTNLSNAVTIAIDANSQTCSEPKNNLASTFSSGGKIGTVRLMRSSTRMDVGVQTAVESANDLFQFDMAQATGGDFAFAPLFSQPPQGSCTVFLVTGDPLTGIPAASNVTRRLDPGSSFTVSGANGPLNITTSATDPGARLGSYAPVYPTFDNELVLNPGQYTIAGKGGADVGAFSATVTFPAVFTWTGRDTLSTVNRAQPLALSWTGVPAGQPVAIMGVSMDRPTNSSAMFYCTAPQNASGFTVPAEVLSALPATRPNVLQSKGVIYLLTNTPLDGVPFSAPGLDAGIAIAGRMIGKTVSFQ
jgi:uncharacterized protein (TIGR03437 family)